MENNDNNFVTVQRKTIDIPKNIPLNNMNNFAFVRPTSNMQTPILIKRPTSEQVDKTNDLLSQQMKELEKIRYENIKLNAQIEVLNQTNSSQLDEIATLRAKAIHSETKIQELKDTITTNNKHYWRNTILIGIVVAIFSWFLGMYSM